MNTFIQIITRIIKEQELIIGPLAWIEANKAVGLVIGEQSSISISPEVRPQDAVNNLVAQYERLFGRTSREVCKQAVSALIKGLPSDEIPSSLK